MAAMKRALLLAWAPALAAALSVTQSGGDLSEALEKEASADASATQKAICWCKDLKSELQSRIDGSSQEAERLRNQGKTRTFENEQLKLQIKDFEDEASEHKQSLDAASSIASRNEASRDKEVEFHEGALKSLRKAMAVIPPGSGAQVRGALQGLEQNFQDKLEKLKDDDQSGFEDLQKKKQEMLHLANKGATTKRARLAEGNAYVARVKARASLLEAQGEADVSTRSAAEKVCQTVEAQGKERERLRQEAVIAISNANVAAAQAAQQQATSAVVLAQQAAITMASSLEQLVQESEQVEEGIAQILGQIVVTAHVAQYQPSVPSAVKAAIEKLAEEAKGNRDGMPKLFQDLRTAARESLNADKKLALDAQAAKADKEEANLLAGKSRGEDEDDI